MPAGGMPLLEKGCRSIRMTSPQVVETIAAWWLGACVMYEGGMPKKTEAGETETRLVFLPADPSDRPGSCVPPRGPASREL